MKIASTLFGLAATALCGYRAAAASPFFSAARACLINSLASSAFIVAVQTSTATVQKASASATPDGVTVEDDSLPESGSQEVEAIGGKTCSTCPQFGYSGPIDGARPMRQDGDRLQSRVGLR